MESKKRDRSANFSIEESRILVDLVLQYKNIIECKKTKNTTWKQKEDAWSEVSKKFNCQLMTNRSVKMLKIKYEGLKRTLKKKKNANKYELCRTAGGTPNMVPYTDYEEKLLEILVLNMEGLLPEEGDCDADVLGCSYMSISKVETADLPPSSSAINMEGIDVAAGGSTQVELTHIAGTDLNKDALLTPGNASERTWKQWTPASLKKPVSAKLQFQRLGKEDINEKFADVADKRLVVVDTQKLVFEKELQIKNIELQIKETELEIKIKQLEAISAQNERAEKEHSLKMLILQQQYQEKKDFI